MSNVKRETLYVICQNMKMSLHSAIACRSQNVKSENVNIPNLRCQMSKYQISGHYAIVNTQNFEETPVLWRLFISQPDRIGTAVTRQYHVSLHTYSI